MSSPVYQKYVKEFEQRHAYIEGRATISEQDLLNKLGAELDMLIDEYGSLQEYAEENEPDMLMELYSIAVANELLQYLTHALRK